MNNREIALYTKSKSSTPYQVNPRSIAKFRDGQPAMPDQHQVPDYFFTTAILTNATLPSSYLLQ